MIRTEVQVQEREIEGGRRESYRITDNRNVEIQAH